MQYKEDYMDLFLVPEDYHLAHCISADFGMGRGIATEFNRRFDMKEKLVSKYYDFTKYWDDETGEMKGTCILEGRVFNLVTKRNYWHKPTYETLTNALEHMCTIATANNINKIAMPVIGCGLDRLKWNKVSKIIQDAFCHTDIEILICKH